MDKETQNSPENRRNNRATETIKTLPHLNRILLHLSRPAVDQQEYNTAGKRLDLITGNISRMLSEESFHPNDAVVRTFQKVIFGGMRLRPTRSTGHGESFLCSTLSRCIGNCTGLTSIYLAVARRLGMPMFAALKGNHVQVIYRGKSKDTFIEPMNMGMMDNDNEKVTEARRILSDREFVAIVLNNRAAFLYAPKKNWHACTRDLRAALRLFPEHPDVNHNLQELKRFMGDPD